MSLDHGWPADIFLIVYAALAGGGGFAYFRRNGCTLAEAAAYSLMALLMIQSGLGQIVLMSGIQALYVYGLLVIALLAVYPLKSTSRLFASQLDAGLAFLRSHPLAAMGLLTMWGHGFVMSLPPMARLRGAVIADLHPLWQHSGSMFTLQRPPLQWALPVLNHVIFSAPWQPSLAIALANLAAYLSIGLGTYALARRYAWPPMAITIALLVTSMPRLVHQSFAANSELLPAAAALTAILALFRSVERFGSLDIVMLAGCIGFSVAGGRLCYLMPSVLAALSIILLARRHGVRFPGGGPRDMAQTLIICAVVLGIFCQLAPVGANIISGRAWIGAVGADHVVFSGDPLRGTPANLLRYSFLAVDLPHFMDDAVRWLFGVGILDILKSIYHWLVVTLFWGHGAAEVFQWSWRAPHGRVWFGPVGFMMILPSLFITLFRGPRRLKSTALAMLCYWVLIAMILAWRPQNVRLMTPLFVCSGFFMAFTLPPWRLRRNGRLLLQILGVLVMAHTLLV